LDHCDSYNAECEVYGVKENIDCIVEETHEDDKDEDELDEDKGKDGECRGFERGNRANGR
jgi:hypothetical protein